MSVMGNITKALNARLETTTFPAANIAWAGVPYFPALNTPYISVRVSGWNRRAIGAGADSVIEYRGTYQVSCYGPAGSGLAAVEAVADSITNLFARGANVAYGGTSVLIMIASQAAPLIDPAWIQIPVLVSWMAYEYP